MQFNPYGGVAAQLAAAIVNAGPDLDPALFREILNTYDYVFVWEIGAADAAEMARWADRLRAVFVEPELRQRVGLVNELLAVAAARPYISQHDGKAPHFHYADEHSSTVERMKAYTAAGLAHALAEAPSRIGHCGSTDCEIVYIDTSRNGRRRYCSARCANRIHVADHRGRRKISDGQAR